LVNIKINKQNLLFGIGRLIMSEASRIIKHSAQYLISRYRCCRHRERINKVAKQPNLVYRNILITKKRET